MQTTACRRGASVFIRVGDWIVQNGKMSLHIGPSGFHLVFILLASFYSATNTLFDCWLIICGGICKVQWTYAQKELASSHCWRYILWHKHVIYSHWCGYEPPIIPRHAKTPCQNVGASILYFLDSTSSQSTGTSVLYRTVNSYINKVTCNLIYDWVSYRWHRWDVGRTTTLKFLKQINWALGFLCNPKRVQLWDTVLSSLFSCRFCYLQFAERHPNSIVNVNIETDWLLTVGRPTIGRHRTVSAQNCPMLGRPSTWRPPGSVKHRSTDISPMPPTYMIRIMPWETSFGHWVIVASREVVSLMHSRQTEKVVCDYSQLFRKRTIVENWRKWNCPLENY